MASVHVDEEDQRIDVRLQRTKLYGVLGRLPVHDLRVVKRYLDENRGICFGHDVVIRRLVTASSVV
jgi:hypothetical protein